MSLSIKTHLQKLSFNLGYNPQIEVKEDYTQFVPKDYKTVLLLSADFELAWASRYSKSSPNPIQKALNKATIERKNVSVILELCEQYNIPITWATVGHLFLESCTKLDGMSHQDLPHLPYFENDFWKFDQGDWFQHDPGSNYLDAPEWYSPDLIEMIRNAKVQHEIGCHTFSHIDCRDEVCSPELIRAELIECKKLAKEKGINLKSFVHPGHTIGNLDVLAEEGFTNFRTDYRNVLGYPKRQSNGLWEFEQTAEFVYRKEWSIDYHIHRHITILKRAIKSNTLCVLWFHPSFDSVILEKIWPAVFQFIDENRDTIWVTTHTKYVDFLEEKWEQ